MVITSGNQIKHNMEKFYILTRIMQICYQLAVLKKGNLSMADYFSKMKNILLVH
jgi:hypothetical protein